MNTHSLEYPRPIIKRLLTDFLKSIDQVDVDELEYRPSHLPENVEIEEGWKTVIAACPINTSTQERQVFLNALTIAFDMASTVLLQYCDPEAYDVEPGNLQMFDILDTSAREWLLTQNELVITGQHPWASKFRNADATGSYVMMGMTYYHFVATKPDGETAVLPAAISELIQIGPDQEETILDRIEWHYVFPVTGEDLAGPSDD